MPVFFKVPAEDPPGSQCGVLGGIYGCVFHLRASWRDPSNGGRALLGMGTAFDLDLCDPADLWNCLVSAPLFQSPGKCGASSVCHTAV